MGSVGPSTTFLEVSSAQAAAHAKDKVTKAEKKAAAAKANAKNAKAGAKQAKSSLSEAKAKLHAAGSKSDKKKAKQELKAAKKQLKGAKSAAKKASKKAKKAAKKLKKALRAENRKSRKLAKVLTAVEKAAKRARRICNNKTPRLTGQKLEHCIERLKKAGIRVLKKKLKLEKAIAKVKADPTRENINKAQHLLKKHRRGPLKVKVKGHHIKLRPRFPRKKKQKRFQESSTNPNYKLYLRKQAEAFRDQIKDLKLQIHMFSQPKKKDWKIEYSLLDPPDSSSAKAAKKLLSDLKPFLKDAKSIKQSHLDEGRAALPRMEKLRWKVVDKLNEAKALPLLPEMYRFLG